MLRLFAVPMLRFALNYSTVFDTKFLLDSRHGSHLGDHFDGLVLSAGRVLAVGEVEDWNPAHLVPRVAIVGGRGRAVYRCTCWF